MTVQILGNGGAISDGLKYNSFVIDLHLLIEVPPDIIETLFSNSIPINQIEEIFISHLHGDHCFGFPFLALKQFFDGKNELIRLIGPKGIENRLKELTILAFGSDHPVMNWINSHYSFL